MNELDWIHYAIIGFCVIGSLGSWVALEVAIYRSREWGENPKWFKWLCYNCNHYSKKRCKIK